jgi:hypothetical protein
MLNGQPTSRWCDIVFSLEFGESAARGVGLYQTKTGMHSVKKTLTRANPFEIIVRKRINHRISYDEVFVIDRLCLWAARS